MQYTQVEVEASAFSVHRDPTITTLSVICMVFHIPKYPLINRKCRKYVECFPKETLYTREKCKRVSAELAKVWQIDVIEVCQSDVVCVRRVT